MIAVPRGPGACGHGDQAIRAFLDGLAGKAIVNDVMQHDGTDLMRRGVDLWPCPKRRDPDRDLVLLQDFHIAHEPRIAAMGDEVHREGRGGTVGAACVMCGQLGLDPFQPTIELNWFAFGFTGIERRKAADDSGLALRNDQFRAGDDEHGCADERQAQALE